MKIFLFLDSNNVFENKVSAAFDVQSLLQQPASFFLLLFISQHFVTAALINGT